VLLMTLPDRCSCITCHVCRYDVGGRMTHQLGCYPGGGARYVRHADASPSCPLRTITAICYLNPGWDVLVCACCGPLLLHTACALPSMHVVLWRLTVAHVASDACLL
jgi:hypothetical protein